MIFMLLAAVLAIPIIVMTNDWPGWLLVCATFVVVPLLLCFRRRPRQVLAIWATLVLHHVVAIVNAYFFTILGAGSDALDFHRWASATAYSRAFDFSLGAPFYRSALALAYSAAGPSLLLGGETSVLAYALSCVVLVRLLDLLKIERHQVGCILIFGLLPAVACFGSVTLREAWEILFFMTSVYFLLRFRVQAKPSALFLGLSCAALMALLHNGLVLYALCMVPYTLFARIGRRLSLSLARLLGAGLVAAVLAALAVAVLTHNLPNADTITHVMQGDALRYAAKYREHGDMRSRAEYDVKLDASSPAAFLRSAPLVYVYYQFSPLPGQIHGLLDVLAALDTWFRMLLIGFSIWAWWSRPPGLDRNVHRFLLILYFSMSGLWAMGTINYGTGIRHHIVAIWILILLGAPPLLDRAPAFMRARLPS